MTSLRPLRDQTVVNEEALEDAKEKDDGEHEKKEEEDPATEDKTDKDVHR